MNIINKIIERGMEPYIYRFFENSDKNFIFEKEKDLFPP